MLVWCTPGFLIAKRTKLSHVGLRRSTACLDYQFVDVIRIHHNDIKNERDLRDACITIAFPLGISEAELHGQIRIGGGGLNSIQYPSPLFLLLGYEIGIEIYLWGVQELVHQLRLSRHDRKLRANV